jgi:hypothetical protein
MSLCMGLPLRTVLVINWLVMPDPRHNHLQIDSVGSTQSTFWAHLAFPCCPEHFHPGFLLKRLAIWNQGR